MSALSKEAPQRQREQPALPSAVKARRRRKFRLTVLVVAAVVALDWMRPPSSQLSVLVYNTIVIKGYRTFLRPIGNHFIRCPFTPTCSVYSEQAMLAHGFPKGVWLTTSRLFRCMPWVPLGTKDPVPEPKRG
jgi:putative membrane protein insertion efficiency factor